MNILSVLKSVLKIIPKSFIQNIFNVQFKPSKDDVKKILKYLKKTRKKLKNKKASIMEQKLTLYTIPYLKYLELSQIDNWQQKYSHDIDLLFDLYIAQGIWHKGIRRIIWNENELTYYYVNTLSLNDKTNTRKKMLSENKWPFYLFWVSFLILIGLILFIFNNFFGKFVNYFFILPIILTTLFGALIMYCDKNAVSAINRIMNKHPDLIQKTKDNS
ncbi:hypothetical protein [Snodgrassella sp. W8132]|uniref:hypothetical protein n=1 Tax=Snodgrassella sp. W8132 TaxID=2750994 RepID=UPI0018DE6B2E|nr:hypothetical protein [Snodgrassella sp. W8132]MBI0132799.1 hypothetical protein [Snodgrassella sp. W8132]